jgi:hypothetical protein
MVWEKISKPAIEIIPLTLGWWEEYKASQALPSGLPRFIPQKWKKPQAGYVKLNVDASFHSVSSVAGLGGVFRDSEGNFLGGFVDFLPSIVSAKHGEMLALLLGVKVAYNRSLVPLIVESDCLDLVQAITSNSLDSSELGFLIEDIRQDLQTASAASIHHVRRSANNVAHLLAREAGIKCLEFDFFSVAPSFVKEALSSDCNDC